MKHYLLWVVFWLLLFIGIITIWPALVIHLTIFKFLILVILIVLGIAHHWDKK